MGLSYKAANGTEIKNFGERVVRGLGDQWQGINMNMQVADVKTTLGSVNQMIKANNRVNFECGNCYIQNLSTGVKSKIEEKGGTFEIGLWVLKHEEEAGGNATYPQQEVQSQ